MSRETQRWAAAAFGFAAAVMWTTVGAGAALTCLIGAGLCAGAAIAREGGLGLGDRLNGVVAGTKRLAQAAVPTPPPARATRQEQRRRAEPQREQHRPAPTPAPLPRPYDHDVPSGEHVYEVANYGW
jgi:hypothetical protein